MMAAGLWNYVDVNNGLTLVSDRYAYESNLGAYQYNKNLNRYEVDMTKLRKSFADNFLSKAFSDLKNEIRADSDNQLRLEVAFTTVAVNMSNGSMGAHRAINPGEILSIGNSTIPDFLKDRDPSNGEIDFDSAIETFIEREGGSLAIPTQTFGIYGSQSRYLPEVPLIAIRTVYNYQNAGILKSLGILEEPYSWDIKVAALRGEVG